MLLLAVAACGSAKDKSKEKPVPEAGFVVVRTQRVPLAIELAGRTNAYETSEVRPQVSGLVKARLFTEGTIVKAGQTLYQIDPSLYRAAAAEARANLANAEAARVAAAARAQRYRPLANIEAVSRQDFADAQATAGQAAATVAQQRALLDTANINLRFTRVPAPITGRIGRSLFTVGALVTSGQADPLTTIQRLDPIFVDIQQSSADLLALRRALASGNGIVPSSAAVRLVLEDGSDYGPAGRIEFAEPVVDTSTGSVTLRATFPNPRGLLLPGMYVRAKLSQATATDAILVPQAGISRDPQGKATVLLVGPGNKAVQRVVKADRTIGAAWLVTGGLKPGDKVIVEGLGRIKDKQPIRPVPAGSRAKPAPQAGDKDGSSQAPKS
ncbi:efflux RND transporter periplasmic adaptor subunit [Sphingomonas profundi]|uniref:efflux RND transporter periplasmic adaptor subunit n=1 Tax=Alterirhizorhabdus profundi TaxID=2681549 RepID=UPI0024115C56|nr:efflux RND transporter periplasmic adaptor subunit [Sphingomonas profundi]